MEAIGITILIPIALIGYLTELANESFTFAISFVFLTIAINGNKEIQPASRS